MSCLREVEHLQIHLPRILLATNNFDEENFIAWGGFGKVYQGQSQQYGTIAVKRLYIGSLQGQHEFMMEIALLSTYKHENLVSLVGFCDQDHEKILVYKHESNGSLDKLLKSKDLNWIQRLRICLDAAHGLKFLHHDVGPQHRILHRDIKSSNILLNENWRAKISDFGLSKISPANVPVTFLISKACGTIGYVDPEYLNTGVLTQKSDVYSFGIVLFEVLCARPAFVVEYEEEHQLLCKLAKKHHEKDTLDKIIGLDLQKQMNPNSLRTFSTIAYQCLEKCREDRPTMNQVVEQLQKALEYQLVASSGSWDDAPLHQGLLTPKDNVTESSQNPSPPSKSVRTQLNKKIDNGGGKKNGWWSFLQALPSSGSRNRDETDLDYVHPMVKRTASALSTKSLEMCTESLGSETSHEFFSLSCEEGKRIQAIQRSKYRIFEPEIRRDYFPPPLTSFSSSDATVKIRHNRKGGRLVIQATSDSNGAINFQVERTNK